MDRESICINELQQTADQQLSAQSRPLTSIDRGATVGNAFVFVDADNQTPALAKPLLRFLAGIGHRAPYFHRSWINLPWGTAEEEACHRLAASYRLIRSTLSRKAQTALPAP